MATTTKEEGASKALAKRDSESDCEDAPPDRKLKFQKLSPDATAPYRASHGAAGYDICASKGGVIQPGTRQVVPTDLSISLPSDCYGRIAPRSGLAAKYGIDISAGVIDSDYRGPVGIMLVNNGTKPFGYEPGQRIAQLILERIFVLPVEEVAALDETERGAKGFGSTGKMAKHDARPVNVQ